MRLARTAFVFAGLMAAASAAAQPYPAKPVRLIVGYSAGATIAAASVATSVPDGYTLFFADTALLIARHRREQRRQGAKHP